MNEAIGASARAVGEELIASENGKADPEGTKVVKLWQGSCRGFENGTNGHADSWWVMWLSWWQTVFVLYNASKQHSTNSYGSARR